MSPFLSEALKLAEVRKGFTSPNPAVGAVLVKDGNIIGRGFHWAAGKAHAEVEAIQQAEAVEGATLYVTLEPCCHFGRTPPCTDLIIQKKIKEVVFGFSDPNPHVSGRGAQLLSEAGIKVRQEASSVVHSFYRQYAYWTQTGKTWITGKLALTRDYKTAFPDGARLRITRTLADCYTHERRKQADVLITSISTVKKDDPLFNVRLADTVLSKPVWVLDRKLEFSTTAKLFHSAQSLSLVCGQGSATDRAKEFKSLGVDVIPTPELEKSLDLEAVALALGKRGFHEAWVECGYTLFLSFIRTQQFQETVFYISDRDCEKGVGPGGDLFQKMKNYKKISSEQLGPDQKEIWMLKNS